MQLCRAVSRVIRKSISHLGMSVLISFASEELLARMSMLGQRLWARCKSSHLQVTVLLLHGVQLSTSG